MHDNYFKAAIPEPYRILGVQLLPFSLTRYRLLKRFDCAFVPDEATTATWDDLAVGILVCSMPVKDFLVFLEGKTLHAELKRWGTRILEEIRADPYFNLFAKIGLFRAYVGGNWNLPKYWNELGDDDRVSGAHWSQSIEVLLRGELGYTRDEIDEGPLSKAVFDYFKYAENHGQIRLIAEGEEASGESNAGILQEALKKKGVLCPA